MTLRALKASCKKHDLYRSPEVNDKLYLHCEGYKEMSGEALGHYCNVKVLWLQKIEGLEKLEKLTQLFVHENCLDAIAGLERAHLLNTLNISKNFVRKIEGL